MASLEWARGRILAALADRPWTSSELLQYVLTTRITAAARDQVLDQLKAEGLVEPATLKSARWYNDGTRVTIECRGWRLTAKGSAL